MSPITFRCSAASCSALPVIADQPKANPINQLHRQRGFPPDILDINATRFEKRFNDTPVAIAALVFNPKIQIAGSSRDVTGRQCLTLKCAACRAARLRHLLRVYAYQHVLEAKEGVGDVSADQFLDFEMKSIGDWRTKAARA